MASERLTLETADGRAIFATWIHARRCSICDVDTLCLLVRRKNEQGVEVGVVNLFCKDCLIFIESARQIDPGESTASLVWPETPVSIG